MRHERKRLDENGDSEGEICLVDVGQQRAWGIKGTVHRNQKFSGNEEMMREFLGKLHL